MSDDILRDDRERGFFWIEDALFDKYSEEIGVYGVAAYSLLARMADGKGVSWPSYTYVAKKLKISRPTAVKTMTLLVENELVSIEEQFSLSPDGNKLHKSNRYTLKNLRRGGKGDLPGGKQDLGGVVNEVNQGGKGDLPEGIHKRRNTQEKEESARVAYLADNVSRQCVALLKKVKGWNKNENETLELLGELRAKYASVDAVDVCEDFEFQVRQGRKYKIPASGLRTFFKNAHKWSGEKKEAPRSKEIEIDAEALEKYYATMPEGLRRT